jgi:hypothetical protein
MQDKSSYSNNSKPQISEILQNFINAMVEEIVLKGETFDHMKKKYLKKYSEAEGLNYTELEGNLVDFLELLPEYLTTNTPAVKRITEEKAKSCYIGEDIIKKIADVKSKEIREEKKRQDKLLADKKKKEEEQRRKEIEAERIKNEKVGREADKKKKQEENKQRKQENVSLLYDNGDRYEGDLLNGLRHGYGIYIWADGHKYAGEWLNNYRHGYGTFVAFNSTFMMSNCPNCVEYHGEWKHDVKDGQGSCFDQYGKSIYDGQFVNDTPVNEYPQDTYNQLFEHTKGVTNSGDNNDTRDNIIGWIIIIVIAVVAFLIWG